jgi:hypothetical protein
MKATDEEVAAARHKIRTANKVMEVYGGIEAVAVRRLDDLPPGLGSDGGREIAILTLACRQQDFQFKPVMEALEKLASMKQEVWAHQFLVAGPNARLDWKESPMRQYASFKDFYAREIEATFGKWENLQRTWSQVVKGDITEDEGRKIILGQNPKGGRPRKENRGANFDHSTVLKPGERNTKAHWLARLDRADDKDLTLKGLTRDQFADLAAKVRAKTMSANAAAEEAGFRKKRERKKAPAVDRIAKLLTQLTDKEWDRVQIQENQRRYSVQNAVARMPWSVLSFSR